MGWLPIYFSGPFVTRDNMKANFDKCFDPEAFNFFLYRGSKKFTPERKDFTRCYYRSKFENFENADCLNAAVVNGTETESSTFMSVLNSDMPICKIPKA